MPWHRPQFRLLHLIALVAVLAAEFAILPRSFSAGVAVLSIVSAILAAVSGPLTKVEWAVIVAIHALLIALLAPAVQGSHGRSGKPRPAPTSHPAGSKI
jgi:membrane protein implicated in regulation of membrane protease activity